MSALEIVSINPPIRGSIDFEKGEICEYGLSINPPIRGSIVKKNNHNIARIRINPPIRGSIVMIWRKLQCRISVSIPL